MNLRCILLITFVLFTSALFFGNLTLFSNGTLENFDSGYLLEENGKIFVSADIVKAISPENIVSDSPRLGESIIILKSGSIITISHDDEDAIIDFKNTYEDVVLINNQKVFLEADFLSMVTGYGYSEGTDYYLFYDKPLIVESIELGEKGLLINFEDSFFPQVFNSWFSTAGSMVISLYPVEFSQSFWKDGIEIYKGSEYLRLVLGKEWRDSKVIMSEGNISVEKPVGSEKTLEFSNGNGYIFEKYRATINNREITITSAEVDPSIYDVSIVLANNKVPSYEDLFSMATRTGAFVMINGGYYDPTTAYPIGFVVNNGEVLSLPSLGRPVFFGKDNGEFSVARIEFSFRVLIGEGSIVVKGVNTPYRGESLLYNDSFRGVIPYREGTTYLLLSEGKIEGIGYRKYLNSGQEMLALSESGMDKLGREWVKPGATARVELLNDEDSTIVFAVEGGPMIIDKGLPVSSDEKQYYNPSLISARAPRTMVGVTKNNKLVFMVIDGYQSESSGLNFNEMVEFFQDKNYESLMCLDGGKSSAILLDGRVVNTPSAGVPRLPIGIMINKK